MTKKIDEAVSLNVTTQQGEMNSTTTFTAEDTAALAAMLKNAGIAGNSTAFNGPATLTVDVSENGGTMNTTIQAPDLRSIMRLLEPEFEATAAMDAPVDAALDQAHADMDAMAADGHEVGVEIYDPGMSPYDTGTPKDDCVDGACDAAPEVDMGMDLEEPEMAPAAEPVMDDYEAGFADAKRNEGGLDEQAINESSEDWAYDVMETKEIGSEGVDEDNNGYGEHCILAWVTVTPEQFAQGDDAAATEAAQRCDVLAGDVDGYEDHLSQFMPNDYDAEGGMDYTKPAIYFKSWLNEEVDESTTMQEYPGVGSKEIVQPKTHAVPARSGDNPIDEGNNPHGEKTLDTYLRDGPVMVMYDHDSGDFDTGLDYPSTSSTGLTVTINSVVDEFDNELLDSLTPEERNTLEQECIDDLNSMEESAAPAPKGFKDYFNEAAERNAPKPVAVKIPVTTESLLGEFNKRQMPPQTNDYNTVARRARTNSQDGSVQHVDDHGNGRYSVSDWMSDKTVGSFSNGNHMNGKDIDESDLNELSNDTRNSYFKKAATDINGHAMHAANQRELGNHDQAAKHDAKIMHRAVGMRNAIAKESEIDEAGRGSDRQAKANQYGKPFYMNTDCGYASLNDIGTHDYFGHDGVVVLAIDRSGNGKWGLNYVAGHDTTAPGTKVTCVTQTRTGDKYRQGKVVDSFTMDEYNNDRAALEARLAKHGITATKKLSVKTFD